MPVRQVARDPTKANLLTPTDVLLDPVYLTLVPELRDELEKLGRGDILPKPGIRALGCATVTFVDGSTEKIDVIVYCTGYKISFPFFDPAFLSAPDNEFPLWMRMMKPGIPNLLFVGLCQPLGAIMPIAEAQAVFFAEYLLGEFAHRTGDQLASHVSELRMLRDVSSETFAALEPYVCV